VPIGMHAAWNFGQWSLGLKGSAGLWQPAGPGAYRTAIILYAVVMLSAALVFTLRYWYSQPHA